NKNPVKPAHWPYEQQSTLPALHAKSRVTNRVEPNCKDSGVLPNIRKKNKLNNVGVHQDQKPVSQGYRTKKEKLPELINPPSLSNKQQQKKQLEVDSFPLSPTVVLECFGKNMTKFEQYEISHYSELWYLGHITKNGGPDTTLKNPGYGDRTGTYTKVMHDHIAYRYEVLEELGQGSYGEVYKCLDHKTSEMVAVKVLRPNRAILEELKILDFLKKKDKNNCYNIVHMKDYFTFRNQLCIIFELLGPNLYEFIKSHKHKRLSLAQVRHIAREMLTCLSMLENEKIIHGDLKPENIALSLTNQGGIKVIDFGMSCYEPLQKIACIGTHVYRAPEVIVRKHYTTAVDMWSLGCILFELYAGQPLFFGQDEVDQMSLIMEVLGYPPAEYIKRRKELFFDCYGRPIRIINHNGRPRIPGSKNLSRILNTDNELFLDFLNRCLTWNPTMRLSAKEALQHPWIQEG
ncbi:dual specificity tyrosine-phosphorylation-regulated kinase 4-like, partial [Trichomycterus rosablanca]|uniref:dual specificity tyrosine-phosphorylation-regulated kinase 4-like n=1 Tax=Trichomycterus rosablanca TaxID=2290929 RepID=UPI002F35C1D7